MSTPVSQRQNNHLAPQLQAQLEKVASTGLATSGARSLFSGARLAHEFPRSFLVAAIIFPHTKWLKKITDYRDTPALKAIRKYFWSMCYACPKFWKFLPECTVVQLTMGAIHKMAATMGDSPTARALRGNFSSQRSLPDLAKHFFLGFLFFLRAKKPHTIQNISGLTPPSRHNADFCFHRAKISDKGLRELLKPASVGNL